MPVNSRRGFTIVELLIVIVVVAVLATISVVAYNSIQTRSKNVAKVATVQGAVKLIRLYHAELGTYPRSQATGDFCLTVDSLCTNYAGTANPSNNAPLISELSSYGTLPAHSGDATTAERYGITYSYIADRTLESQTNPVLVMFFLEGTNQVCTGLVPSMVSVTDSGAPRNFAPATRASGNSGGKTRCYMMFPN